MQQQILELLQSVSLIQASIICQWWIDFKLEPIFATAPAAFKNEARF